MADTPQMPALPELGWSFWCNKCGNTGPAEGAMFVGDSPGLGRGVHHAGCDYLGVAVRDSAYTATQMHAFRAEGVREVLERALKLCAAERAEHMEQAGRNDGRQSDMAFGSVNSAERLAEAIRTLAAEIQPPQKED